MSTIDLTPQNCNQILEDNEVVLVEFWAPWSSPSRTFAATYGAAAERHTDIIFARVDVEAEPSLATALNITSIPTLAAFKNNVLEFALPDLPNATGLEEAIQEVRDAEPVQVPALALHS